MIPELDTHIIVLFQKITYHLCFIINDLLYSSIQQIFFEKMKQIIIIKLIASLFLSERKKSKQD